MHSNGGAPQCPLPTLGLVAHASLPRAPMHGTRMLSALHSECLNLYTLYEYRIQVNNLHRTLYSTVQVYITAYTFVRLTSTYEYITSICDHKYS